MNLSTVEINSNEFKDEMADSIAITVLLISLAMLFGTLFFGYAVYRLSSNNWPPMGIAKINLFLPILTTLSVCLGSIFFEFSKAKLKKSHKTQSRNFLILSIVMGLAYGIFQFSLWTSMKQLGLYTTTGIFPSLIYAFTWIHAAHMLAALVFLFWAYFALLPKEVNKKLLRNFGNVGTFWHFLTGVWFLIFIFLFVL